MSTRRESRSAIRLPVSIGGRMAALSADVSNQGFCLETPSLLASGRAIQGYVLHGDKELPWEGEVLWVQPGNPMASTWHRVGVRFTWLSVGLRVLLALRQRNA